jgi:hypothetical protein
MVKFLTALVILVLSILIITLAVWYIQPLTPFNYSLTYSEWLRIVSVILLLRTETNQN